MARKKIMERGKQQILYNYLPGKTFDFQGVGAIAKVTSIQGQARTDLNADIILQKISEEAHAWSEEFRPSLNNDILSDPTRFVLVNPKSVQSGLFPKVFWCQNRKCGRVFDYSHSGDLPRGKCSVCQQGNLAQLRFVKVHRCGAIQPLTPPSCPSCKSNSKISLDTRGSERLSNFAWYCECGKKLSIYAGRCKSCDWPSQDNRLKEMDIMPHRAGNSFYAQNTVLLNIPNKQIDAVLNTPEWQAIVASKWLDLPQFSDKNLMECCNPVYEDGATTSSKISDKDIDAILQSHDSGQMSPEDIVNFLKKKKEKDTSTTQQDSSLIKTLEEASGISFDVWERCGHELLETIMPFQIKTPKGLFDEENREADQTKAKKLGLDKLVLLDDFPIITATYGYSRIEYSPANNNSDEDIDSCRLNSFPAEEEYDGRFPIYVDEVQADALFLSLSPKSVITWLNDNGFDVELPKTENLEAAEKSFFVNLFDNALLGKTLGAEQPHLKMVFGLLHSLSHLSVRQAALLCGLDTTSLSEYLMPRSLSFAIYCNHRFGATIGALTALYEQSLSEWLSLIKDTQHCVYDPVCYDNEGSCHACSHLAETSCRFFNLNLNRAFLFGGHDPDLGEIKKGFFAIGNEETKKTDVKGEASTG